MLGLDLGYAQTTTLQLEIEAPTRNADGTPPDHADGSPLTDLAGYIVCQSPVPIPDDRGTADCSMTVAAPRPDPQPGDTVVTPEIVCDTPWCYYRVAAFDTQPVTNTSRLSVQVAIEHIAPSKPGIRLHRMTVP